MRQIILGALGIGCLAACGGGSSSGLPSFEGLSSGQLVDRVAELNAATGDLDVTSSDALAASGTISHLGVVGVFLNQETAEGGIGEFAMTINLANGEVSGRAGNFVNFSETTAPGTLILENARVTRAVFPTITGDLTGTVAFERGPEALELGVFGFFRGDTGENTTALLEGTGTLESGESRAVSGAWWTERQ